MAQDILTQQVNTSVANTGGTDSTFTAVGSLGSAVELPANNRRTHAGATTLSASNLEGDDLAGARLLTSTSTLTYYRESGSLASNVNFQTFIWEYTGAASGANEFKVTRFAVDLNGTTATANVDITSAGVTTAADCIPIITGIMNNATVDDTDSATSTAYLTSTTNMVVNKGSASNNVKVYISLVEFTGSAWTVLHGRSTGNNADTGSVNLFDGSDGTGSAATVTAWANSLIFGQYRSNTADGTDDAIADNWPRYERGTTGQVNWAFHTDHVSVSATEEHVVHVLEHADMDVTIFTNASSTAGETTIDITSAGLTSLDQALIVGSSTSSGTGVALPRGYRNYYFNSITQMAHWCTRSGNTCSHYLQVVDLIGLVSATNGISSVTPSTFAMNASSVVVAGLNFQSTQTTGTIYLSDATTLAGSANEVDVSSAVTAWSDTSITLNLTNLSNAEIADLVALGAGARHIIVLTSAADEYSKAVTLQDAPAVVMSLGAGTDGASTSRLTGMTGTFTAGRFTETANPSATTTDVVADGHTEMVFSVELTAYAEDAADYEFRLLPGGAVPGTITQTPTVTVGAGGTTTPKSIVSTAVGSATVTDALILGQTVSATSIGSVVLDTLSTFARTIAVVTNSIPTLDRLGTYLKTIAVTATAAPTLDTIKTINQAIVATVIGVVALATQLITSISQSITATANGVVTFTNALTLSAVINATAIGIVSIPRTVYKTITAIATGDVTQIKTVYKSIFVFAVGFVDVSRVVYKEIAVIAIGLPIALAQIAVSQSITAVAVGVANISTSIIVYVGRVSNKIYVMFRTVFSNIFSNKG